jgi:glutathione S-transferase
MNTLANEHKKGSYINDVNPSGQIPTIVEGNFKILGGNNS